MTRDDAAVPLPQTALLLMDFQLGVLAGISDADRLLTGAGAALSWARDRGVRVFHVRVSFTVEDFDAIPDHNKMLAPVASSKFMFEGSDDAGIHPLLTPRDGEEGLRKTRVSAFSANDLDVRLRACGIDTLVMAGVSTSGVLMSTVIDAADRDYRLYALRDASADPDVDLHDVLFERFFPRVANVINSGELW